MPIDQDLAQASHALAWATIGVYVVAMVLYALAAARAITPEPEPVAATVGGPGEGDSTVRAPGAAQLDPQPDSRMLRLAVILTVVGVALNIAAVVLRGFAAHRAPWGNMYEFILTACAVVGVVFIAATYKQPRRQLVGVFVVPVLLLALGLAVLVLYVDAEDLLPSLKSGWLVVHVAAAITATAGFLYGGILSGLYLWLTRKKALAAPGRLARMLPTPAAIDTQAYRVLAFTFPIWTFAVVAGAIWAEDAWGRYWGWDPKETWAFITWVIYASYLHARVTVGWKGRNAAWIALAGVSALIFNLGVVNLVLNGLHSYAGV